MSTCLRSAQRHKSPHFLVTHISLKCFFSHVCIILLPSYDVLCYAQLLMYPWCKSKCNFLSVWHWLESTAKEKTCVRCGRVSLHSPLWSHLLFSFNCVPIKINTGTGNDGKWQYIFGAIILWKITMLSTWCLYLVPFLVIKKCWNPWLSV